MPQDRFPLSAPEQPTYERPQHEINQADWEKEDTPYFHIMMPSWWGDVFREGYNTSLVANAIDLTAQTEALDIPDVPAAVLAAGAVGPSAFWNSRIDNVHRKMNTDLPDFMRKAQVSDDYSEYSEDILFDIGATLISIGVDAIPIAGAGYVSGGIGWGVGAAAKAQRVANITDKIVRRTPQIFKTLKEGFKKKGVGDATLNKVVNSLYKTMSNPSNLIHSGNTLAIYGGAHNLVDQKLHHEDGASWSNKVDFTKTVDASLSMWKAGAVFPIGSAVGKSAMQSTANKIGNRYIPGTSSAKILEKVSASTGEVVGGGYAFAVPEHGFLPEAKVLAHSIGVVGGLKGIGASQHIVRDRAMKANRAFQQKNLTEKDIQNAQDIIGTRIDQDLNYSHYKKDGTEVKILGETASGKIRYTEVGSGKTQWMNGDKFHKEHSLDRSSVEFSPVSTLNSRIETLAEQLGAFSPKAKSELYYDGAPPKLAEGKSGLREIPLKERFNLLKKLHEQKIGNEVMTDMAVAKIEASRMLGTAEKVMDFLRVDALNKAPLIGPLLGKIPSIQARIYKTANPHPLSKYLWRKFNAFPSIQQSWLGSLVSRKGLYHHLTNKNFTEQGKKDITRDLETGNYTNKIAKDIADSYQYIGGVLRERGIIPEGVPLLSGYAPHYLRDSVKDSMYRLQEQLSHEGLKYKVQEKLLEPGQDKVIERAITKWMKKNKSVGAGKVIQEFINSNTVGKKTDWTKTFEQLNKEMNIIYNNPFYNFTQGRTTEIKWNVEKNRYDKDIFHTDAIMNKFRYLKDASEALAVQESFGNNNSILKDSFKKLEGEGRHKDVQALTELFEIYNTQKRFFNKNWGSTAQNTLRDVTWLGSKTMGVANDVFTASLVSLGWGAGYNWFQPLISYQFVTGYMPSVQSGINYFKKGGVAEKQKLLAQTGMKTYSKDEIFGLTHSSYSNNQSLHRKVADVASRRPWWTGFLDLSEMPLLKRTSMQGSVKAVHEQAILAGFEAIPRLMYTAKTGDKFFGDINKSDKVKKEMERDIFGKEETVGTDKQERNKAFARERLLNDFNITYTGGKLTSKEAADGAVFFADRTQLKRNPATETYYMSHPAFRHFFRLKSFMIKQTKLVHDTVSLNMKYGNHAGLLRMAIAASAGQQMIGFKEQLEETLSGKDIVPRLDAESIIDGAVQIGMGGMAFEVALAEHKDEALSFNMSPLSYTMYQNIKRDYQFFIQDESNKDFDEQYPVITSRLSKYFGGPTRGVLRRFEDTTEQRNRLIYIKGRKEEELFNMWIRAYNMQNEEDKDVILKKMSTKINEFNRAYGHITRIDGTHEGLNKILNRHIKKEMIEEQTRKGFRPKK